MNQNASIKLMSMKWESNSGGGVADIHNIAHLHAMGSEREIP